MNNLRLLMSSVRQDHRGPFIGLLVLLISGFAVDFVTRALILRDDSMRSFTIPQVARVTPAEDQKSILKRFEAWVPAKLVVEAAPPEREISLQGVFGAGVEARAALALSVPGTPPERIRATVGQVVDGWTVERITPGRVFLKKGEELKELVLFRSRTE